MSEALFVQIIADPDHKISWASALIQEVYLFHTKPG